MLSFDRKDELQIGFLRARIIRAGHPLAQPPTHYIPTTADFARATLLGLGWSLLPEQQCAEAIGAGTLVELDPEHPVDVPLFWQRWNLDSHTLTAVTAAVRDAAAHCLAPTPAPTRALEKSPTS
jgi:LysR family transcriptional regulator (chromosome initiation inhibitor)